MNGYNLIMDDKTPRIAYLNARPSLLGLYRKFKQTGTIITPHIGGTLKLYGFEEGKFFLK